MSQQLIEVVDWNIKVSRSGLLTVRSTVSLSYSLLLFHETFFSRDLVANFRFRPTR